VADRADWRRLAEQSGWSAAHEWIVDAGVGYRVRVAHCSLGGSLYPASIVGFAFSLRKAG
jgi:hypothetical protein